MSAAAAQAGVPPAHGGSEPLLKMSELAERSGVSAGTIRHYLREGLLGGGEDIVRTSRNMAYYPAHYVQRIATPRDDAVREVRPGDHRQPGERAVGHRNVDELPFA